VIRRPDSAPPAPPTLSTARRVLAIALLALAAPLLAALWSAAAQGFGAPSAWMAVIVVADASLLLQLLRWPPGATRTALAFGFLLLCSAASLWLVAAGVIGPAFGLLPWESALRMGPVLFEVVSAPWWTAGNAAWMAAAVALGLWWNR
jgi:hypothetical protein